MKKMNIRNMEEKDIPQIFEINLENMELPWSISSIKEDFNNKLSHYFVCENDNIIVGYISFWYVINEAEITNIAVTKSNRGKGIGKALLEKLIEFSVEENMIGISLEVSTKNFIAINLYQKYDFEINGTRPEYYEKSKEDAYILWKEL